VASTDNGSAIEARADEARLTAALEFANIPILLPVLVQLTGDDRWL
jgi:hypothetical protein